MNISLVRTTCNCLLLMALGLGLMTVILPPSAIAQSMAISTLADKTGKIALYKPEGKKLKCFALLEIKGRIEFGDAGILKGEEAFLRLQTIDAPDKWLKITKQELIKGKVVITTEDNKIYTIYDLQGDYIGKIMSGRGER